MHEALHIEVDLQTGQNLSLIVHLEHCLKVADHACAIERDCFGVRRSCLMRNVRVGCAEAQNIVRPPRHEPGEYDTSIDVCIDEISIGGTRREAHKDADPLVGLSRDRPPDLLIDYSVHTMVATQSFGITICCRVG